MRRLDAHAHARGDHADSVATLRELDIKVLNISLSDQQGQDWRLRDAEFYRRLAAERPDTYAWCTTFDAPSGEFSTYAERVIAQLDADFGAGAIACKVWKNIGMSARDHSGRLLLIDDPLFAPILEHLQRTERTLLIHTADPLAAWLPLDPTNIHYRYFTSNPQWYMGDKPQNHSHEALILSRDRIIERYPMLRVVGAHLGSLEHSLAQLAHTLQRYPNFAVDTSARLRDLSLHPRNTVRQLFDDFPDRLIFGTDLLDPYPTSTLSALERNEHQVKVQNMYRVAFAFYESHAPLAIGGESVRGLNLDDWILQRFFHDNACHWYPGL